MNVLAFNIQTIPDIDGARRLYDLHGLSEEDVAKAIFHKRRQQANTELLNHHVQKIVAISAVLVNGENFKIWSLGDQKSNEEDLLQRFFAGIQNYTPTLISWNGNGFDLPVIHYRSLIYPVNAERYWNNESPGDNSSSFQHNHIDLMETLSGSLGQAEIGLDEVSTLCGFPGSSHLQESSIWPAWLTGNMDAIRQNGECKVLNTYLIYLNWQRNRGLFDQHQYLRKCQQIRDLLKNSNKDHLIEFENNWIDL